MRFGLSDFVENLGRGKVTAPRITPEALRAALSELGPAFIKLGQILSTREEWLPENFRRELAKLQDQIPAFSTDVAVQVIEAELGSELKAIFSEFDSVPLASGSIGQAHRARLLHGENVVVKVQRPGVDEILGRDSAIIRHLSAAFGGQPDMGDRLARLVSDFLASTESELDYLQEGEQLERFAWQFEHEPGVRIPRWFRAHSSKRVLVMTYVPGTKVSEVSTLGPDFNRKTTAERLASNVLKQIFSFGFFHGDPHPANVFVLKDGSIGFYDLGLVGELSRSEREYLATLLLGLLENQADVAMHALLALSQSGRTPELRELRDDVTRLIAKYFRQPSAEVEVHRLLHDILQITARHRITLPNGFYLVFKVLATLESAGRTLDPEFDLAALAAPVLRRTKPAGSPAQLDATKLLDVGCETLLQLRNLPAALQAALDQLNQGQIRIQFEHRGLEDALSRYEGAGTRLSAAIFAGAIALGGLGIIGFGLQARMMNLPQAGATGAGVVLVSSLLLVLLGKRRG